MIPKHLGLDTSSLNAFRDDPHGRELLQAMASAGCSAYVSALNVVEIMKWREVEKRDGFLALVELLRATADFKLLPLPHEVIDAEFQAWLERRATLQLGGEAIALGMQVLLSDSSLRTSDWVKATEAFCNREEASHQARILRFRAELGNAPSADVPKCEGELVHRLLHSPLVLAAILNEWFADHLLGRPAVRPDEAVAAANCLPRLRAFLVTWAVAAWRHGVRGDSLTKRGTPGSIDIQQAAYLPGLELFVVDDEGMRKRLADVGRLASLCTELLSYEQLRARVL